MSQRFSFVVITCQAISVAGACGSETSSPFQQGSDSGGSATGAADSGTSGGSGLSGGTGGRVIGQGGALNSGGVGLGGLSSTGGTGNGGSGTGGSIGGNGGNGGIGGIGNGGNGAATGCGTPLDLFFLVDKSGSMIQNNKSQNVSAALVAFANDPAYAAVDLAVGYFPLTVPGLPGFCCEDTDCGSYGPCVSTVAPMTGCTHPFGDCQGLTCQASWYAKPEVPFILPPDHSPFAGSIQAMTTPGGGTPTAPALQGVMQYVATWVQANPGRKAAVVLATDGDPTGCTANTVQDVSNVASTALAQNAIRTFVIGVGTSLTSMNQVAQAGGTGQAFVLDETADLTTQIANSLAAIYHAASECN